MRPPPSPASEFPNDNPELHDGAIWTASEPGGALRAEVAHASAGGEFDISDMLVEGAFDEAPPAIEAQSVDEAMAEIAVVAEVEEIAEVAETAEIAEPTAPAPPVIAHGAPPPDDAEPEVTEDAFTWLLRAMSSCAVEAGVILDLEDLEMLLCMGRVDVGSLPAGAADALAAGGFADVVDDEIVARAEFAETAHAWRRVLCGEDEELGSCGARTLDEWSADVLARLLGAPQRADALRRELRRRGVAAFGVLLEAA